MSPMRCLHCHSSFLPLHPQLKRQRKLEAKEQAFLFSSEAPRLVLRTQEVCVSILPLRTNAISNPFFVAAKIPPSQSGDITNFLRVSALLLVVYFLGNFVAPYFISKYYEFDKIGEEQKNDENDDTGR